MQCFAAIALCFVPLSSANVLGFHESVTPVQKVIDLLNGMLAQGKDEKHKEEVQYSAYKQFCDDTSTEKKKAIEKAELAIELLEADIEHASASALDFENQVTSHQSDVSGWEEDQKGATDVRNTEQADYEALHKDYSESIDALERAIQTLKAQDYNRPQAESLAQVSALRQLALIPADAKRSLELFLAQGIQSQNPEAHGYEFQSGDIIEILEELLVKFKDSRTSIEQQEANAKHAYNMLYQDLAGQIETANNDINSKSAAKASMLQTKAQKSGTLADTEATKQEDENYLTDMTATCERKAADYSNRQHLRSDEIASIEKAIEILSGDAVTGAADKHLPSLVTLNRSSLAALRALAMSASAELRVHEFLVRQAHRLNSRVLAELAERVGDDDPFGKVKQMINDLIVRLTEEAGEEASHKQWCDSELASNKQTRDEKTETVNQLHAEIDMLEASIAKLSSEISDLNAQVAQLDAAMAEATSFRSNESATNAETTKDAQDAQTAVAEAIQVLSDFYSGAAGSTSLMQKQQPVAPEIFESPYKGMQVEHGNIQALLEVIQSDFARLEADTIAAEEAALQEYNKFMSDSKADKTAKDNDIDHKTNTKQADESSLNTAKTDLDGTQKELDAALEYYDELKPACVDASVSYDDRVARREEEIQSLQEALKILGGEAIA